MTLRHMKIFVAVCTYGSVTEAGKQLFIAQPTISLAIRELEDYYGIRLFDRMNRKLHLTPSGEQFLDYARHIVDTFQTLETEMKNWDKMGLLRIGSSITIGNYFLSDYVRRFQKEHPAAQAQIIIDNSAVIEKLLLKNELDFGLIEGNPQHPNMKQVEYMEDELSLLAGPEHPLTKKRYVTIPQLKQENFIMREKGSAGRDLFDSIMAASGIEIHPIWQSASTQAILQAVAKGLGLSVLPYLLAEKMIKEGKIVSIPIKDAVLKRHFSIIYHQDKFITPMMQKFFSIVQKYPQ